MSLYKRQVIQEPLYPISNVFLSYEGVVEVGTSKVPYPVLFDTGSCQFWLDNYDGTKSTAYATKGIKAPRLSYMDGTIVDGVYVTDSVKIANVTLPNLQFESATSIEVNGGIIKGLLGLCHKNAEGSSVSFLDEGVKAGYLTSRIFSFSISSDTRSANLSLGGFDTTRYGDKLAWVPVLKDSVYWEAPLTGIITSTGEINWTGSVRAIFDTGSSMLVLPPELSKAVNAMYGFKRMAGSAVYTGACPESIPEFLKITVSSVSLNIKSKTLVYGNGVTCYSSITDGSSSDVAVIGNSVLRNYYTVFDAEKHTVGFATLQSNGSTDDITIPDSPPDEKGKVESGERSRVALITMITLLGLLLLTMAIYYLIKKRQAKRSITEDEESPSREEYGTNHGTNTIVNNFPDDATSPPSSYDGNNYGNGGYESNNGNNYGNNYGRNDNPTEQFYGMENGGDRMERYEREIEDVGERQVHVEQNYEDPFQESGPYEEQHRGSYRPHPWDSDDIDYSD